MTDSLVKTKQKLETPRMKWEGLAGEGRGEDKILVVYLEGILSETGPGTVAHSCNLSYLGGGDWEDHGSRLAWVKG
jgi:hypothetical protein